MERIQEGLQGSEGVLEASVNLATEKATGSYDSRKSDLNRILHKIRDLGYDVPVDQVTIPIAGMSCASCVEKIEQALIQTAGVIRASVNLATEKATVDFIPGMTGIAQLRGAITSVGYEPLEVEDKGDFVDREEAARKAAYQRIRGKFITAALLTLPIFVVGN